MEKKKSPKISGWLDTLNLNSDTVEPVQIDNAVDGGIDTKPDKVPNGDNVGEGLPQLVTGLLLNEEVAGVEDDLEGGAAGLLLPPVAQDSSRQTVVLVHNPGEGVGDQESDEDVLLNT